MTIQTSIEEEGTGFELFETKLCWRGNSDQTLKSRLKVKSTTSKGRNTPSRKFDRGIIKKRTSKHDVTCVDSLYDIPKDRFCYRGPYIIKVGHC